MDHSVSLETITLMVMMAGTCLTVAGGWIRVSDRLARVETDIALIKRFVLPVRRAGDSIPTFEEV